MIADNIGTKITDALKARDEIRLSTLKLLSSALSYEKIAKQRELSEEEEITVVRREIKKREEAISDYRKAEALERVAKEGKEKEILQEFLPPEISAAELTKIVIEAINKSEAKNISDMGKVMVLVKSKLGSQADGARIAQIVKSKLI